MRKTLSIFRRHRHFQVADNGGFIYGAALSRRASGQLLITRVLKQINRRHPHSRTAGTSRRRCRLHYHFFFTRIRDIYWSNSTVANRLETVNEDATNILTWAIRSLYVWPSSHDGPHVKNVVSQTRTVRAFLRPVLSSDFTYASIACLAETNRLRV